MCFSTQHDRLEVFRFRPSPLHISIILYKSIGNRLSFGIPEPIIEEMRIELKEKTPASRLATGLRCNIRIGQLCLKRWDRKLFVAIRGDGSNRLGRY